jgi:putative salt-induced outer membrane protein YdiY
VRGRPRSLALAAFVALIAARGYALTSPAPVPPPTTTPDPEAPEPEPPLQRRTAPTPRGTVVAPPPPPKSEVAKEGIPGGLRAYDPNAPLADTTELSISGGALLAGGNSRLGALTGALRLLVRRGPDQFSAGAAANYARAATSSDQPVETTVENYQAGVRYDHFLTRPISVFLSVIGRRDRFQGLSFRLSIDPGVALYMVRDRELRLWSEVGYDFQNDVRTNQALDDARASGVELAPTEISHNGRLFLGYAQHLEERLLFEAGIEYIRNMLQPESWRLNYSTALTTKIASTLSIGIVTAALYDNNPLPDVQNLDVSTAINLVYTLY